MGPNGTNIDLGYEGPTLSDLQNAVCTACEANVWTTDHGPVVAEYDTGEACGYCSNGCYFEHWTRNQLEEVVDEHSVFMPP